MTVPSDVVEAEAWYRSQPKKTHDLVETFVQEATLSLYGESQKPLLSKIPRVAPLVLIDRALISQLLFRNTILLLYRLFGRASLEEFVEGSVGFLDAFFSEFKQFLARMLQRHKKEGILEQEVRACVERGVDLFLARLFPDGISSLDFSPLPVFVQKLASSYVEDLFEKGCTSLKTWCTKQALDQKHKDQLFTSLIFLLHSFVLTLRQMPKMEEAPSSIRIHCIEEACYCLLQEGTKSPHQGAKYLLSLLYTVAKAWQTKGPAWLLESLLKDSCIAPSLTWLQMEERLTDRTLYEPMVLSLLEPSSMKGGVFQVLFHGFASLALEQVIDQLPWDKSFDTLLFAVRRLRRFTLSNELFCVIKALR